MRWPMRWAGARARCSGRSCEIGKSGIISIVEMELWVEWFALDLLCQDSGEAAAVESAVAELIERVVVSGVDMLWIKPAGRRECRD